MNTFRVILGPFNFLKSSDMKRFKGIVLAFAIATTVFISFDSYGQMSMKINFSTPAANELRTNMRKLWEDHVTWTRNVILVTGFPALTRP